MFEDSPISEKVFGHFNTRIGQMVAPVGLSKVISIYSSHSEFPRLNILHEARSREWKTQSTKLAMKMFNEDWCIAIYGEKTIHAMKKDYGTDWDRKCVCINDGNIMFSSLAQRTRQRWESALSSLLTERKYEYGDNVRSFTVKGRISLMMNMATPAFSRHKGELSLTTLGNRLFIVHAWMKLAENRACKKNFTETTGLEPKFPKIDEHYDRRVKDHLTSQLTRTSCPSPQPCGPHRLFLGVSDVLL